jgi:hypothetical protein
MYYGKIRRAKAEELFAPAAPYTRALSPPAPARPLYEKNARESFTPAIDHDYGKEHRSGGGSSQHFVSCNNSVYNNYNI